MQGIFINMSRPKSKKAVKEAVANGMAVYLQATSVFGNEYDGPVDMAPHGEYYFVGPDPERLRNFYGKITVNDRGIKVT